MNDGNSTAWIDSEAGQKLKKRLSNEQTINGLDGLLAKIDSLEKAVQNLSTVMQQGPGMVAMATDIVDEAYRDANARGVHLDERLKGALTLAERLTEPSLLEKLDGVLSLANQAPGLAAMSVDIADETLRNARTNGVDIEERLGNALVIAEKLTTPAMVQKIDTLVAMSDQLPGLVAMTVDMADEAMKKAIDKGFDLQALGELANASNRALTAAKAEPPTSITGIFSLIRTLNDKDRQKGLGFLMNFLKHLGRNI